MSNYTYVAGNLSIASLIKRGDCRMMVIADSINGNAVGGMMDGIAKTWNPDRWAGFGAVSYQNCSQFLPKDDYNQSFAPDTYYTTNSTGPNGCDGWIPTNNGVGGRYQVFSGATIPAVVNNYSNRIYAGTVQSTPTMSNGFLNWLNDGSNGITAKVLGLANSRGIQSFDVVLRHVWGDTAYYNVTTGQSARATNPTYTTWSVATTARTYSSQYDCPEVFIRPTAGTTPASGDNFIGIGSRIDLTGLTGLHLVNLAIGGINTTKWANLSGWSQEGLNAIVNFFETNLVYIWLGQNNGGNSAFAGDIVTIMNNFKAANPLMQFLLFSPYQTDPSTWGGGYTAEDYSNQCRAIANSRTDTLFLDLWRLTGGMYGAARAYNFLNAQYLRDTVHPAWTTGSDYFARTSWSLIELADAQSRVITSIRRNDALRM